MKWLLVIFINVVSIYASGQTRSYAGYIRIGTLNVHDAQNSLSQVVPGINGFKSEYSGIGGELEYRANKAVVDAELMVLSQKPANSGNNYAEPFTGAAVLKAGYVLLNRSNLVVYPNAGAGFGSVVVNTYQKSGGVKQQLHSIYMVQPVFDLGLNVNVIVYRFKSDLPTGILPIGIRGGFRFSFEQDNWRRVDESTTFKKDYSMRGWYLSVALGMGYLISNQKTIK